VLFPRYLPCYAGKLLEKEIRALEKINLKSCLFILGGSKPEDNLKLIKTNQKNKILTCGIFGQLCNIARGYNLGKENEKENKTFIKNYNSILKKLKRKLKKINKKRLKTPEDFAVKINEKRQELSIEQFPTKYIIYDIGEKTIKKYKKEIKKAKSIYMKGPAGFCGYKDFCKGTKEILKTIAKSKGFSLIGGGHLSDAIKTSGISKNKFNHISLSGGALLRYLAGEKLPGIEILKKRKK
jgi:phosphoglycerate kinase